MNKLLLTAAASVLAILLFSGCTNYDSKVSPDLSSKTDSLSYSFGYLSGNQLASEEIYDIDYKNYLAGFQAALDTSDTSVIDNRQMQILIQTYLQELEMQRFQQQEAEGEQNREQGAAFLEENLKNSDVFETESGLQYRVMEEGTGVSPTAADSVEVHYEGRLLTDEVFDSSYERNETATFVLNQVIEGWTEGVQLMSEGAKYQFFIPANLAYGNNPPPGSQIPPGAVLVFDVELIDVK